MKRSGKRYRTGKTIIRLRTIRKIYGDLIFIGSAGTGITSWSFLWQPVEMRSAVSEKIRSICLRLRRVYQQRYPASVRAYQSVYAPNIVFAPSLLAPEESLIYQKYVRPVIVLSAPYQILEPHIVWQGQILQILGQIFALQEEGGRNELSTVRMLLEIWGLLEKNMEQASGLPKLRRLDHEAGAAADMIQLSTTTIWRK